MDRINNYTKFVLSLKSKKVLIWGLGVSGGGLNTSKYFLAHGAKVRVTDLKAVGELQDSISELDNSGVEFTLGQHKEEDFLWADLIIKNPAIPRSSKWNEFIAEHKLEVAMELDLFLQHYPGIVIGITGTRGKSTTTAQIFEMIKASGRDVFTGGNNKLPLLTQLDSASPDQIAVVEMSSFQLSSISNSPHIAVVTNIYPDHLNWHTDMQDYIDSKVNITKFQTTKDIKILNIDNLAVKSNFIKSGEGSVISIGANADYSIANNAIIHNDTKYISESEMKVKGAHNLYNLALAIAAVESIGVKFVEVKSAATEFAGLQYRQQLIRERDGIKFINDSCATTPEGVIAAIDRFRQEARGRLILIAGGVDKGVELANLVKVITSKVDGLYLLEGTLYDSLNQKFNKSQLIHGPYHNFNDILLEIKADLKAGDIVLMSPGGSSFNLFKNEWDRGEQFDRAVNDLS